jgi:ubiquinone/menaquinone biosynthesis C-methylase UbiE
VSKPPDEATDVDRKVSVEYWNERSKIASDPRSVTLDKDSVASVNREIRRAQRWLFTRAEALGCTYQHVADLACGNGDWTVVLAGMAKKLFVMDLAQGFLDATRARIEGAGPVAELTFVQSDLASVQLPADLDLAICGAVFQYLDDADIVPVLERIRSALRPGGILYVRTTIAQRQRYATKTETYQAIYRPAAWYDEQIAAAGFDAVHRDNATDYMATEIMRDVMGKAGAPFVWPLRLLRRLYRWTRKHNVQVWILKPRA